MKKIVLFLVTVFIFCFYSFFTFAKETSGNAQGFSFVLSDKQGNKKSTISGSSANFLNNGMIIIQEMKAVLHKESEIVITTKKAMFDKINDLILTDEFIEIISASMEVSGMGADWHSAQNKAIIRKEVKVVLLDKEGRLSTVVTASGKMDLFLDSNMAHVYEDVVVENKEVKLLSNEAVFFFESGKVAGEGGLEKLQASGQVKIFFEDKVATSGKADYSALKGILELTDSPQIEQNGNLYTAEKITIVPSEDRVEFEPNARLIINQEM